MEAFAPGHLIILVAVLLLVFGSKRLPEMGRGIGQGLREFQHGIRGTHGETPADDAGDDDTGRPPAS
ncbi:MAG: twin-arginine translocase TatA/TatE family subunit [Thermoleophilia bacterium]